MYNTTGDVCTIVSVLTYMQQVEFIADNQFGVLESYVIDDLDRK